MIQVIGNGWNITSCDDSHQKLAEAVYGIFSTFVGKKLENNILVRNDLSQGFPIALYEKNNEDWEIILSCASGTHWAQMAYQLAHELCHLYCNHSSSRGHKHKWFEESLCECASIAVLYKLGSDWNNFEISAYNATYGVDITNYINDVTNSVTTIFESNKYFACWLLNNIPKLESCSTQRDINRIIAVHLFNSILNQSPENWVAITSLNLWDCYLNDRFNDFIESWLSASDKNINEVCKFADILKSAD
ncbi:hypothetical protein [Providencia sp. Me31A]|uniref:hypothetical protein n=1 Tax=Providencia sp. Me31A TaxID=3392637 RepID=UPI003D2B7BB8